MIFMNKINCALRYRCPKSWDELKKTADGNIRFCDECNTKVYWIESDELQNYAGSSKCVAYGIEDRCFVGNP